jgi:hypothetical protein
MGLGVTAADNCSLGFLPVLPFISVSIAFASKPLVGFNISSFPSWGTNCFLHSPEIKQGKYSIPSFFCEQLMISWDMILPTFTCCMQVMQCNNTSLALLIVSLWVVGSIECFKNWYQTLITGFKLILFTDHSFTPFL